MSKLKTLSFLAAAALLAAEPALAVHLVSQDPTGVDYHIAWRAGAGVDVVSGKLLNGEMQLRTAANAEAEALGAVKFEYAADYGMLSSWAYGHRFGGTLATYGEARVSVGRASFLLAPDGSEVEGTPFTAWIHLVESPSAPQPADVLARYSVNGDPYVVVGPGSYPLQLKVGNDVRLLLSEVAFARAFDAGPFGTDVHFQVSLSAVPPPLPPPMPIPEPGTLVLQLIGLSGLLLYKGRMLRARTCTLLLGSRGPLRARVRGHP